MREKIVALAKGEFIYRYSDVIIEPAAIDENVEEGKNKEVLLKISAKDGGIIKGFGTCDDTRISFSPIFNSENVEMKVVLHGEKKSGSVNEGNLVLVTDHGEFFVPYKVTTIAPQIQDEKGQVKDFFDLQRRIVSSPENAISIFRSPEFKKYFLENDEKATIIYDHLSVKNTKIRGLEEFLVATNKKDLIKLRLEHSSGDSKIINYRFNYSTEEDEITTVEEAKKNKIIMDAIGLSVSTWGLMTIKIESSAKYLEPEYTSIRTDEFDGNRRFRLNYKIHKDMISPGYHEARLIFSTQNERKEVKIIINNTSHEKERKAKRERKKTIAELYRNYIMYKENRLPKDEYVAYLNGKKDFIKGLFQEYQEAVDYYIAIMARNDDMVLKLYRKLEEMQAPNEEDSLLDVENYILLQYIKYLRSEREDDKGLVFELIDNYSRIGFESKLLSWLLLHVDKRFENLEKQVEFIRKSIQDGNRAAYLFSRLAYIYQEEPDLMHSLDNIDATAMMYSTRVDSFNDKLARCVAYHAERITKWDALVVNMLKNVCDFYEQPLKALCSILIKSDKIDNQYNMWYEMGIESKLRITELFEYYMYTLDYDTTLSLPDSVLSYFQYENHLNEKCKAFLYSTIVRKKKEKPETYEIYKDQIEKFADKQILRHRINKHLGIIYDDYLDEEKIRSKYYNDAPYIMYVNRLVCNDDRMVSVAVVHPQMKEEIIYQLSNKAALVEIFTEDYQIYFIDKEGFYHTANVDYTLIKLSNIDKYAIPCWEQGSEHVHLLCNLMCQCLKNPHLNYPQLLILSKMRSMSCLRRNTYGKVWNAIFSYVEGRGETKEILIDILREISDKTSNKLNVNLIKDKEKIFALSLDYNMYESAKKLITSFDFKQAEKKHFLKYVRYEIDELEEDDPIPQSLIKYAIYLYREKVYDDVLIGFLKNNYLGASKDLLDVYKYAKSLIPDLISDKDREKVLGQFLFSNQDLLSVESIYNEYYDFGLNRAIVKAYLMKIAYEYVINRYDLSDQMHEKINKEAFYGKDDVIVLAGLKYLAGKEFIDSKDVNFIERNLEKYNEKGIIFEFMKEFENKNVSVPYEILNNKIFQYIGPEKEVYVYIKGHDKMKMQEVIPGLFLLKRIIFCDEEIEYAICDKEENILAKGKIAPNAQDGNVKQVADSLFNRINELIELEAAGNRNELLDKKRDLSILRKTAKNIFVIK